LSQAIGVGSPLARLVGVICLSTGALIDAAMGPFTGKGTSELGLLRQIEAAFCAGDVMLADAFYCNYFLIAALQRAGVDVLFAQNGARITDFRRGERLGNRDHRVSWPKPKARPDWMSAEEYAALPEQLTLREVKVGKKILVTSFLWPRDVSKTALGALFRQRWHVELDFEYSTLCTPSYAIESSGTADSDRSFADFCHRPRRPAVIRRLFSARSKGHSRRPGWLAPDVGESCVTRWVA
jgi:hypothetical protein